MKTFLPAFLIIISLGLFFLVTEKNMQKKNEIKSRVVEYDSALDKAKEILKKRAELQEQFNKFSTQDLDNIYKILPDNVDNIQLVLDINGMARDNGIPPLNAIKIENTLPNKDAPAGSDKNPVATINLSFGLSASYDKLLTFLRSLEESLRIVDVTGISFKSNKEGEYDYTISIKTYWLKK